MTTLHPAPTRSRTSRFEPRTINDGHGPGDTRSRMSRRPLIVTGTAKATSTLSQPASPPDPVLPESLPPDPAPPDPAPPDPLLLARES